MSYQNANQILPQEVIELIQEYTDGTYVYIPRKEEYKKKWGEESGAKQHTAERNRSIYQEYLQGRTTAELADAYFLSIKSIQRIVLCQKAQT